MVMKDIVKRVPLPICGLMLGVAALGNLLQSWGEGFRYACGITAGLLLVLFLLKCAFFPEMIRQDMENPVMASVAGTLPMSLMLLSVYAKPWLGSGAFYIWIGAILMHIALIIYFSWRFLARLRLTQVFASYYIIYVGIVAASVTAPAYGMHRLGEGAFWLGFSCLMALFVLVTLRYVRHKEIPEPAKPLICIYAAPLSLCVTGYIQSVEGKNWGFVMAMSAAAGIVYLFALAKAVGYLKLPFYPSLASLTFPFVISAIAAKQLLAYAANAGGPADGLFSSGYLAQGLQYVVAAQTIIATAAVLYTLIRFMSHIFGRRPQSQLKQRPAS